MNKKIFTLLAAFLAAGYSVTAEAGIVKITTPKTTESYVIAAGDLTGGADVKVLINNSGNTAGTLGAADMQASGFTDATTNANCLFTFTKSQDGTNWDLSSGSAVNQTKVAYTGETSSEAFSLGAAAEPLALGSTEKGSFSLKATTGTSKFYLDPATATTFANEGSGQAPALYVYAFSTDITVSGTTANYFTVGDKYLVRQDAKGLRSDVVTAKFMTAAELNIALGNGMDKAYAQWTAKDGVLTSAVKGGLQIASVEGETFTLGQTGAKVSYVDDVLCVGSTMSSISSDGSDIKGGNDEIDAPSVVVANTVNAKAVPFATGSPYYLGIGTNKYVTNAGAADESATAVFVAQAVPTLGTNVYKFVKADGQVLSIKDQAEFIVEPINGTNGFYLKKVSDKTYLKNDLSVFAEFDEDAGVFSLVKPDAKDLDNNGDLAAVEKNGFTVTLKYGDGKTNLEGNPFVGHLTMMSYNSGDKKFTALDANTTGIDPFYLKSSKGFIVATGDLVVGNETKAYQFTTISEADLKKDLAKEEDKRAYTSTFSARYFANEKGNLKEIELYLTGVDTEIGYYDIQGKAILAAGANTKDVTFALGSTLAVKPADLLVKGKFFSFVKVDKEDGNKTLAVKLDDDVPTTSACGEADFLANYSNELEAQWALTVVGDNYVFTNRESKGVTYTLATTGLYRAEGDNTYTYAADGKDVTCIIAPIDSINEADGYVRLSNLKNTRYNLGYWSNTFNGAAWFTENHNDVKKDFHVIGLDQEKDALEFAAVGFTNKRDLDKSTATDSIYVISTLGYYDANGNYKTTLDTLKVVSYSFINQYNEPLKLGEDAEGEPAYGSVANKYKTMAAALKAVQESKDNEVAQKFTLRKDGDKLNLRPIELTQTTGELYREFNMAADYKKMYSGDAKNGILNDTKLYGRAENDLFVVEEMDKPMYRPVINNLDTIAIYRNDNDKSILFEKGLFLGMENLAQYPEIAPAMVADSAHNNADGTHPQYMLMVEPEFVVGGKWCPEHGLNSGCSHEVKLADYIKGRYLVNLKDTAVAWEANKVHGKVNPYINTENNYKLGFVPASHIGDTLLIASDSSMIKLNDDNYNVAKFSFRYVNQEDKSFVIETADYKRITEGKEAGEFDEDYMGYLKWMNGVVIVVNDIKDADVYNMTEGYDGNPTANEAINGASTFSVATIDGAVVVKGAEGKKVVISNVLGQTIASTVITSSEATIAAPAGYVTVAVEGEAAVKAIVK